MYMAERMENECYEEDVQPIGNDYKPIIIINKQKHGKQTHFLLMKNDIFKDS